MKRIFALLLCATVAFTSCGEDNDDNIKANANVNFKFSHTWDNTTINSNNLTTETVTNANGEVINMTRIRYLISKLQLVNSAGIIYSFDGYKFTDLEDINTYDFTPENNAIPAGTYTLKFVWGFNEEDNIDGNYTDLNSASWNWPSMLGGGYHFLQFDGMYNVDTTPSPFNFHNGTARVSMGVFEQNFATIELETPLIINNNATINISMDISELFKNPNTWDLNVLDTPLMPNYDAQKLMQQNVMSLFSIEGITQ
ncbi:MbnP family protein [Lacinutrix jangbogonensis]|uniref:MbnP family protein n=1 Tax=Lacinutrix jangbogonensis TaxID=1469557 RepID=UPI00053EFBB9|nr:MbnP family protein [Lacinutrix jangbogonensis]